MTLPEEWNTVELQELINFAVGGDWGKDRNFEEEGFLEA